MAGKFLADEGIELAFVDVEVAVAVGDANHVRPHRLGNH